MQMVKKIVMVLAVLWLALLLFMPKSELYYLLEHKLVDEGVKINERQIKEGPFGLSLYGAKVYYRGVPTIEIAEVDLLTLLVYHRVTVRGLGVDPLLKKQFPDTIKEMVITHSPIDPLHITVAGQGSFGDFTGSLDLRTRKLHIDIVKAKKLNTIQSWLKKGEKGYYYETTL